MAYQKIKGVIPPVITPFKQGRVDYQAYEANVLRWNESALAGYLVLGSNSEAPYLEPADKLELIRVTKRVAAPDRLIMAGTGLESTRATIDLTNQAGEAGADCALLLTPCYYGDQMTDAALIHYFSSVADASEIPILIYNVTKFTHLNISPAVVAELSHHPNIIGMKDSSGSIVQLVSFMVKGLSKEFNLLVGTASAWYPALTIGIEGAVMALANCCPDQMAEVQRLFEAGDLAASQALYQKLFPVNICVTGKLGVAALKHACGLLGYTPGEVCPPLLPLSAAEKDHVEAIIRDAGLLA